MLRKITILITIILLSVNILPAQSGEEYRRHLERGYELYDAEQWRAAQAELLKAKNLMEFTDREEIVRLEYTLADCSGRIGENNSREMFASFLDHYPHSIYSNDIIFSMADTFYMEGSFQRAVDEYKKVDIFALPSSLRDEYLFKLGYSYFMVDDLRNAYSCFSQIGEGEYKVHADYYNAYINYINGNYAQAKTGFIALRDHGAYEAVIPYYIIQIEYLEGNYAYVISNGDALLRYAEGPRAAEIARIMAESWFHSGDYFKTLDYLDTYNRNGGSMGRAENYLAGYSSYVVNDVGAAIVSLMQVAGPDDKLTQNAAYHLAGAYLRAGQKREAMRSFSMAASSDYDASIKEDALFNYGKLQFELGGGVFNEAINILSRYVEQYPYSQRIDEAREYLAAAYYNSRNFDAAYDAIIMIPDPDNNIRTALQKITYFRALEYYNMGESDLAFSLLEESLKNRYNPKYSALAQFWKAEIWYSKGDYKRASALYREYISLSPATEREHKMAKYNLGYCYFEDSKWSESQRWFDDFVKSYTLSDSYRADAYNRLGDIFYSKREFSAADRSYLAAINIGTQDKYYAQYQRAVMSGIAENNAKKAAALNEIVRTNQGPFVGNATYELGRTYIDMDRFSDAASVLKGFIDTYSMSDKYLAALSDLGLIYQNLGNNPTALNYYKMLVQKAPNSPEAKNAMIALRSIYVDMNDVDGYFAFASLSGVETDLGAIGRDSLTYAAAERRYLTSADKKSAYSGLKDYLEKFPRGIYRPNALYYISEAYIADNKEQLAITSLQDLSDMHYNSFTVRGLEKLGPMLYSASRYGEASEAYKKLAENSVNPQTVGGAYDNYLRSLAMTGDDSKLLEGADAVIAAQAVPLDTRRYAKFIKGEILEKRGDAVSAMELYREVATETHTSVGAQATLKYVEMLYGRKDYNAAEKIIISFAEDNSPHTYELGRAFLILGDIYAAKGDTFQARATLQSIVDGYSPSNDGVIQAAKERIEKL